jgi:8-oxo-dGTP diphosphatase
MRLRESVRALVLDPDDNVLLVRFHWDGLELENGFWANPGGGIEPGESRQQALERELREEVGILKADLGPELWTKTSYFDNGAYDGQVDHIHLVRAAGGPTPGDLKARDLAVENIRDVRWWPAADVIAGLAVFAPRDLPKLLDRLLTEGPPPEPVMLDGF